MQLMVDAGDGRTGGDEQSAAIDCSTLGLCSALGAS